MTCCVVVLSQDVVEDILSRLPVKSLQRLRCLSKTWDSLISAQSFARMHLGRPFESSQKILIFSPSRPLLSLDHEIGSSFADEAAISRLDFPAERSGGSMVVGSCHGLICLTVRYSVDMDFYLWNPSTGNYKNLSYPYCLVLDKPSLRYQYAFGFGYDSFSDDYKVFLGCRTSYRPEVGGIETDCEDKVAIFSTRENCWRIIQLPPNYTLPLVGPYPTRGSFVNGALHWLVPHVDRDEVILHTYYTLVAFDLKTERFFELPMPEKFDKDAHFVDHAGLGSGLGIFEGRLCLSVAKGEDYSLSLDLSYLVEFWVMKEYGVGQSWTRLLNAPFQSEWLHHLPLCLSKDNQIILAGAWDKLTRIDAEGRKLEECMICKCDGSSFKICFCEAIAYLESLVWPFLKGTCVKKKEECA